MCEMNKKLRTYRVLPGDSTVFAVSLVEMPAVDSEFVALAAQQRLVDFKAVETDEKRMLYGVVLRADYPIYRVWPDGEECYITFSAECIERIQQKFFKEHCQSSWSKDHMDYATGLTMTESWLVTDPECDKAKAIGLENFGKGDWIGGCKVDDDETWHQIKEGRFTGFSVESEVWFEEIGEIINEQRTQDDMKKTPVAMADEKSFWEKMEALLSKVAGKTASLEDEEQPAEETPEEVAKDVIETVDEQSETPEEAQEDLQAVIDRLEEEIAAKDEEIAELKKKNQKLSKQPSAKPVVSNKQGAQGDWRSRMSHIFVEQ